MRSTTAARLIALGFIATLIGVSLAHRTHPSFRPQEAADAAQRPPGFDAAVIEHAEEHAERPAPRPPLPDVGPGRDRRERAPQRPLRPSAWRAEHPEEAQSFEEFARSHGPIERSRTLIALEPLPAARVVDPDAPSIRPETLDELQWFLGAYFQARIELLPEPPQVALGRASTRFRKEGPSLWVLQYHTGSLNQHVVGQRRTSALLFLGIAPFDLYPDPADDFAFGEVEGTVGVISLARFGAPYQESAKREEVTQRSLKLVAHETGHLLGLPHCTDHECIMNGCATLEELDRMPLEPCPICLRKLQHVLRFDAHKRERALSNLLQRDGRMARPFSEAPR